jgi:PKD repeat protein
MRRLTIPALGLAVLLCVPLVRAQSQAGVIGQWTTLSSLMPINPVHLALLRNGKVLVVSGSGNVATETHFQAGLWDPQSGSITTQSLAWDMFCNAMVTLPDGRVLINGGNLQYDPFHGQLRNAVYDPSTDQFTDVQNMAHGRWYPTATVLGDGRVMTFSGLNETGSTNTAVEFYTAGSGWSAESAAGWTPPLYPRMHLLKDGRVLYSGSGTGSRIFNPTTKIWSAVVATTNYSGTRTYGTSVLLPLSPADGYQSRVMIFGGGNPATTTTEILDLSAPSPQWQNGPPMSQPRIEMNATILPNGKVLATGGSKNDEDLTTASLNADLYDPATNTFTSAGVNAFPRLYHSGSLLLPDATVALLGGNPTRGSYESHIEIYSPAYLFNVDGSPAVRPTITGVTPGPLTLGGAFQVQTPNAADIASVVLVRPGAPTHAFDMDQRLIRLPYSSGSGVLDVTAPPDGNTAPPGYYMLFVLNSAGVPSIATFVQFTPAAANQAPQASIVSPAADVTINPGQTVSFSASGTDSGGGTIASYSWTFPGGNPASSSQASPGNVTYSSPGTYVASFTVTDNGGLTSQPATRTVVVTDFSLSANPASQAVDPGSSPAYSATVTPGAGFTGVVTFGVTGLPAGATASFAPASVTGSGTTTLTVSTIASTPSGTYPLRITATSGPVSHSFDVTLVVNVIVVGDFTIAATPASRTIPNGNSTTYSVAIAPNGGFSSTVTLSVGALPKFTTASFSPASLASGTSTLTLGTKKQTKAGSYSVVITASGGGRTHTSTVTLIVQ